MPAPFECPACGGPLDHPPEQAITVVCPWCKKSVNVPPNLPPQSEMALPIAPGEPGVEETQPARFWFNTPLGKILIVVFILVLIIYLCTIQWSY